MAGTRKGPRMIHEILRLKSLGLGKKRIALALGISKNTVRAHWRDDAESTQSSLDQPVVPVPTYSAPWANLIDWEAVKECTDAGDPLSVVLEDLIEKLDEHSSIRNVGYVSFWREFKRRYPHLPLEFHKTHPPGERCEIDFKGARPNFGYWVNGRYVECERFGAILCFS